MPPNLRAQRPGLSLENAVILASAQTTGRILVTRNTADFPAEMPGIRVPYSLQESQLMCGIIGIVGNQPVAARLVDGLKRMEYRGYDSAGDLHACTTAS